MRPFRKLLVASLKEFVRDRTSLSFTIVFPLLLLGLFGFVYHGGTNRFAIGVAFTPGARPTLQRSVLAHLRAERQLRIEVGTLHHELSHLRMGTIDGVLDIGARSASDPGHQERTPSSMAATARGYFPTQSGAAALVVTALERQVETGTWIAVRGQAVSSASGNLNFVVPGLLAMAIMWLGTFAAIPLVQQREQHVLRRFAVTPLPRTRLVAAQVAGRLLVSLVQAVFILAAADLLLGVPLTGSNSSPFNLVATVAALVLLGALCFVAIGYAVAALSPTQHAAHGWAQILTMPMLLLSGVFFPITLVPMFLRPLVAILPLTYLADALRQVAVGGSHVAPLGLDVALLGVWALVALAVSTRWFRWS